MKKIKAIIEKASDGTYSIYCEKVMFSGMGNTPAEAKEDMMKQMELYKQTAIEDGIKYPRFLDGDFEFEYQFDVQSLLAYYSGILTLAGLERVTGIHQKQLWAYLNNKSKPRRKQIERIEKGLHDLGAELSAISL